MLLKQEKEMRRALEEEKAMRLKSQPQVQIKSKLEQPKEMQQYSKLPNIDKEPRMAVLA